MTTLDQKIRAWLNPNIHDPQLVNAIRSVLDLHQPYWGLEHVNATCPVCADDHPDTASLPWPCPTIQAIAADLGITQETPNAE